jgi:hypothetical protein
MKLGMTWETSPGRIRQSSSTVELTGRKTSTWRRSRDSRERVPKAATSPFVTP